jgi:hypothetical protein
MLGVALGVALTVAQHGCPAAATTLVEEAARRAAEFELAGAAESARMAAKLGCADAQVAALYLQGLVDARQAFLQGAPPESLTAVRAAAAALQAIAQDRPGSAEVARLALLAAAAGAQSEKDEMRLYLETAAQMESLLHASGQPGAPMISSLELAGDLWLQVFHYDDARRAYVRASERSGATLRILAGLARTASRLRMTDAACADFRRLVDRWEPRPAEPAEIAEARAYLRQPACQAPQ